ncbi:enoyl-CoA hydratase/isomerase family protein [Naegleria gruberi]|uniref:Enoyl-CoA hydratase/isomerase family protein n=1 Tax=Naegleria gruberi TaxID=5762 RepID=D2VV76_NAEGR|nr:enoyl-CoA hydratase/isomerase family protein [Naegleria gruberi]EFC39260.1 enoyl-CoA hydratase/isomerase family protein [Naegleria gruberi]|eukprot:XP_002672004.1 enoyl-CoA hydratase/isomerase family protein [Naegleria gruberi strain NEG-M]
MRLSFLPQKLGEQQDETMLLVSVNECSSNGSSSSSSAAANSTTTRRNNSSSTTPSIFKMKTSMQDESLLASEDIFTSHHHTKYHNSGSIYKQHPLAPKNNYKNISVSFLSDRTIQIIKIQRPEVKNAIDRRTADELYQAFFDFEKDVNARVAILYGSETDFCVGADLKAVSEGNLNQVEPVTKTAKGPLGPTRMSLSKPVIAAIGGGYCVAGGLELACWCDLRVCKTNSIFGVNCRRYGVPLIDGGSIRLPTLIGLSRAMDLILTGREIDGKEAHKIGLINRIISKDENVLDCAVKLANQLCVFPQLCMRNDKTSALEAAYSGKSMKEKLQREYELGLTALNIETVKGAKAFVNRKSKL